MPSSKPAFPSLLLAASLLASAPIASAAPVRLVASDDRGVTLEFPTDGWKSEAPDASGRVRLSVPGGRAIVDPGRALLPAGSALIAVPPGAEARARVVSDGGEDVRDLRVALAGKPVFREQPGLGLQPAVDAVPPVLDVAWPPAAVEIGTAANFRGRSLVPIQLRPFRYDEATGRLWIKRRLTVRVDFVRAGGTSSLPATDPGIDRHVDPVLATTVLNFEQAKSWRVPPERAPRAGASLFARPGAAPSGAAAFDEDFEEVRVQFDTAGVYVLFFDDLAAGGYPLGVPIAEVSVHRHDPLGLANPPYQTIEIPVEITDGNTNGTFDSGDEIWLHVRSWQERTGITSYSQRRWGDFERLYVTRKAGGGARMAVRSGWRGQVGLTPLASAPTTLHYEGNYRYTPFPRDTTVDPVHWTEITTYYDRPDTIRFDANDLDTLHQVTLAVNWVGRRTNGRYMWAAVRNASGLITNVADSVFWTDRAPYTATRTMTGSAFSEGRTNSLRTWGKTLATPPDPTNNTASAALNSFDVTYWRRYKAITDYLACTSGDGAGEIQIHPTGFTGNDPRLYDVTDPDNPVRVTVDPSRFVLEGGRWSFDFQDSVAAGSPHRYVAVRRPRFVDPARVTSVQREQLYARTGGDYVVVVADAFRSAMGPLVSLRQSQGMDVVVAPTAAMFDEFGGGRPSAHAIQAFMRYAYANWQTRFLLLVGDATQDPKGELGVRETDWVPTQTVPGPVFVDGYEMVTSDPWFGCLTGDCNPITNNSTIVVPEIMVGRLPVHSIAEATAVVSKITTYENLAGDQSWRRRLTLMSDDCYSGESLPGSIGGGSYSYRAYEEVFRQLNEVIQGIVLNDAGLALTDAEVFNERYFLANEPYTSSAPGDTVRPDRQATILRARAQVQPPLFTRLNEGRLWWNYQGHANEFLISHESFYQKSTITSDVDLFLNDSRPTILTAFSCHVNAHAYLINAGSPQTASIGEEMVNRAGGGAIASWASTGYEIIPSDNQNHINTALAEAMFSNPPRDDVLLGTGAHERGARVVLGEAILAAELRHLPNVIFYPPERGIGITYVLLGDPAQRISIGQPQTIVTANAVPVSAGQPVRLHTPGDTLRLIADLVSTVRIDSLGLYVNTGSGDVAVPSADYTLTPAFPDTATGNVAGGRRFLLSYGTSLLADTYHYTLRARDRDGLVNDFVVQFQLDGVLRVDGTSIADDDDVSPTANLSMLVLSPKPVNPATELTLTVNGASQPFTSAPNPGDASGREWILSWTHADYPLDNYVVVLSVLNGGTVTRRFRVTLASGELRVDNLIAFPNPFEDELGTYFSFNLRGSEPVDVKISVFTVSGRKVAAWVERSLAPGYHQLAWSGRDAESDKLANGIYVYRLTATTPGGTRAEQMGRLVKLRKPRRVEEPTSP